MTLKSEAKSETEAPSSNPDVEAAPVTPKDAPFYPGDALSTFRHVFFVGTLCTAMFTTQVGFGCAVATTGAINETYSVENQGELAWAISGYSLTVGTFILIGGRLGDEFGSKKLFIIGMAWYALWALIAGCGVYSSHVLFIIARVFQGIGPALTMPNALAMMGQSYSPGPRKNMSFAWFAGTAPFGAISGFAFGGLFALAWWPWIFWSQAIANMGVAAFAAWAIPVLPSQRELRSSLRERLEALDIPGGITGVAALVLFNFAWTQAGIVGWQQPYVYVCLILGVLFGALFLWIEFAWAKNPILPLNALTLDIGFVFGCTGTGWACFGIYIFYVGQVAIHLGGNTPIQMAAWLSPTLVVGLVSALAVGKLLGKIKAHWIMLVGQIAFIIGSLLAANRPVDSVYWTYFFFSIIVITIGIDTSFPAATVIFSDAVEQKYQGIGASLALTVVNYSVSIGLAFAGTVEDNVRGDSPSDQARLDGYRGALWFSVGLAGLGFILSLIFIARNYWKKTA
ncbi:major facilitator superfamily-domain-containing protein [Stachybotrys elegans]|uniref:Major facilitator superfamily-domain-containing protein n=1 Tax=Stachybotrys elegans TaxID=80388 RepID=A0A8K0SWU0_9HYPO|nr:major facilitator superfamily-domain-containing protein [Stachybotrys elegans]